MNAPRPVRKPEDLRAAARYVSYEIEMMIFSGKGLGGWYASPRTTPPDNYKNMALESFLLHFRNLRAFLCPTLQALSSDDIIASDFLDPPTLRDLGDTSALSIDKTRLDRMLDHLSYSRRAYIAGGDHGWKVASMLVLMLGQIKNFLSGLPEAKRPWFPPEAPITEHIRNLSGVLDSGFEDHSGIIHGGPEA